MQFSTDGTPTAGSVSAKNCIALSASEKSKLLCEASRGISLDKFKPLINLNGLDSLLTMDNLVGFITRKDDLESHLALYGLTNVFYIFRFDKFGRIRDPSSPGAETIIYLSHPQETTLKEVIQSSGYLHLKGSLYDVENICWSYKAIMNSCNHDLRMIL
jgi:hypothetical protein